MTEEGKWIQLTICCDPQLTDALTDFLIGVTGAGVEFGVEDELITHTLHAYVMESNPSPSRISSLIDQVMEQAGMLAELFSAPPVSIRYEILDEQDWGTAWKKHFTPFSITPGLVIKPTWEKYRPEPGEQVIEMDPGMAFGTGHHATTSLCMQYIREALAEGCRSVLDVGTGTGILGMAAALFGAQNVLGIDNDPQAVSVAADNVSHNGLTGEVEIGLTPLHELEGSYDLVVANIIHDVLLTMKEELVRLTRPGGILVLSGILAGAQAENIINEYRKVGFTDAGQQQSGEWIALLFKKE